MNASLPSNHPPASDTPYQAHSGIGSPVSQEISQKIVRLLSEDDQIKIQDGSDQFKQSLELFKQEITSIRETFRYDYADYEERLIVSEEQIAKIFKIYLKKYSSLNALYHQLLSIGEKIALPTILQQRLFDEIFLDFLLETPEIGEIETKVKEITLREDHSGVLSLGNSTGNCLNLDLPRLDFRVPSLPEIENLFQGLGKIPYIFTNHCRLHEFENDKLKALFSRMSDVKLMHLGASDFHLMTSEQLDIVFGCLSGTKRLILRDINLGLFSPEMLGSLFENLRGVVSLAMNSDDLCTLSPQNLGRIFENLTGLRHLELRYNSLNTFDAQKLVSIFRPLGNIRSIDVSGNALNTLDEHRLSCIFDNLPKVEQISLLKNEYVQGNLITLFPHLKGKIIYDF